MVLPAAPTAKHITLPIPQHLQMHQPHTSASPRRLQGHSSANAKIDPFCKHISKWLLSGKAPSDEVDIFTYIKGLLYKHVMDSSKKFLALVIPKYWHFIVLVEADDKLGHQGINRTYHLIKWQYYWKGMNKDIHKYINNCTLCKREEARRQVYPLQITYIPDRPFYKIAIDLVSDLNALHQEISTY